MMLFFYSSNAFCLLPFHLALFLCIVLDSIEDGVTFKQFFIRDIFIEVVKN